MLSGTRSKNAVVLSVPLIILLAICSAMRSDHGGLIRGDYQTNIKDTAYSVTQVNILPGFPGGPMALQNFLKGYKIPQEAIVHKVTGRLYIRFVIDKDGSVTDIGVLRDLGYGTTEEAIRLLKSSPRWVPGIMNGRPVKVAFTQPINISAN